MFSMRSSKTIGKENPMRARELLHTLLDKTCKSIDKRIKNTLFSASETLIFCKELSIAGLRRSLPGLAKVKHKIKCIDRLFGNENLHLQRKSIYAGMAQYLMRGNKAPIIIVDWSGLTPCGAYHFLSASLAVNGRSITLAEKEISDKEKFSRKKSSMFIE